MFLTLRQKLTKKWEVFLQKYEFLGIIGEGGFGVVRKARERNNPSKHVAVKQFKFKKIIGKEGVYISVCREIGILRELKHENVIEVYDTIIDPDVEGGKNGKEKNIQILMVFPYCKMDVLLLRQWHFEKRKYGPHESELPTLLDRKMVKSILWQVFSGLKYLHSNWIIHRDIKPSNLFIDERGVLKIGDFGLARIVRHPLRPLGCDGPVVTQWYRAPELLMGSQHYTPAIDVWSVGATFYELVVNDPMFRAEVMKDNNKQVLLFQRKQLECVVTKLGIPTPQTMPQVSGLRYFDQSRKLFSQCNDKVDRKYFDSVSKKFESFHSQERRRVALNRKEARDALDLLKRCLYYDPNKRITCKDALEHAYFKSDDFDRKCAFRFLKGYRYPAHTLTKRLRANPNNNNNNNNRGNSRGSSRGDSSSGAGMRMSGSKRYREGGHSKEQKQKQDEDSSSSSLSAPGRKRRRF